LKLLETLELKETRALCAALKKACPVQSREAVEAGDTVGMYYDCINHNNRKIYDLSARDQSSRLNYSSAAAKNAGRETEAGTEERFPQGHDEKRCNCHCLIAEKE